MPVCNALDGFDVAAAVDRMLGQFSLWRQALALFVEHFANWAEAWQGAQCDPVAERKKVHALRSAAANVGAVRLSAAAGALEDALAALIRGETVTALTDLRQELAVEFANGWQVAAKAVRLSPDDGEKMV